MFKEFGKIPRYNRDIIVTEKIDGSNAQILILYPEAALEGAAMLDEPRRSEAINEIHDLKEKYKDFAVNDSTGMTALVIPGSRSRFLMPVKAEDNFGFASWVLKNKDELIGLGEGRHFGEWWGRGINRAYGQQERRFSLFNVNRWTEPTSRPSCCDVVPIVYQGPHHSSIIAGIIEGFKTVGSKAAPGFMKPEGVIVYHTGSCSMFKVTCENDDKPKTKVAA